MFTAQIPRNSALAAVLMMGCGATSGAATLTETGVVPSRGGTDRIGKAAPELDGARWAIEPPVGLDGHVRVIRFWTDACPFCRASAPALRLLDETYRERGLAVVGIHHPKPRGTSRSVAQVREAAARFGWEFGVAIDDDHAWLDAFWTGTGPRAYTSVTFVLDRQGVIRYVHPGPEFHPGGPADHAQCRADYDAIVATIEALLDEPSSVTPS